MHLSKFPEARDWILSALAVTPAANQGELLLAMGDVARFSYDYPTALDYYDKLFAVGDTNLKLNAALGMGYAGATLDPKRAAARLDVILGNGSLQTKDMKNVLAQVEDLRARAALNQGDLDTAQRWITRAVADSGGLTTNKVTSDQVAIRGDAAIVERLRGNEEKTREYLTYTGAGHMPNMDWLPKHHGDSPVCGVDGDARPEDSAVVQLLIDEDGHVRGALPVYVSRSGNFGMEYARKVNGWYWNPDKLKDVKGFWRTTLRFEMRCVSRPSPEQLSRAYRAESWQWLIDRGAVTGDLPDDIFSADPRFSGRYGKMLAVLFGSDRSPIEVQDKDLDAMGAPAAAHALLVQRMAEYSKDTSLHVVGYAHSRAAIYANLVPLFRRRFPDAPEGAWLELEWALALEDGGQFRSAAPLLEAVLASPEAVLPADDPVRRVALLHAALVGARGGDATQAEARLAASGLGAEQCALFDTHPVPASMSMTSSQFPTEALRWNFEGYVQEAYDIDADGHVTNVRTVLAYPPFVFGPATEKAVRQFRYVAPSIDGKAVGCNGQILPVQYRIPSIH